MRTAAWGRDSEPCIKERWAWEGLSLGLSPFEKLLKETVSIKWFLLWHKSVSVKQLQQITWTARLPTDQNPLNKATQVSGESFRWNSAVMLPYKHPLSRKHFGYEGNMPGIPPGGCVLSVTVRKGAAAGFGMIERWGIPAGGWAAGVWWAGLLRLLSSVLARLGFVKRRAVLPALPKGHNESKLSYSQE